MTPKELQQAVVAAGYPLTVDGKIGPATKAAVLSAFTDGPDTKLTQADIEAAAHLLDVKPAKIWAVWDVEASDNPFTEGRPTILFEPHIFSKLTAHKYDASHPALSSRNWNRKLYPGSQKGRWDQLLNALVLDPDAALQSASYGGFQILGMNYQMCGHKTPWAFIYAMSRTEKDQLIAFVAFVKARGLTAALQKGDWAAFAKGYNGSAYRENKYDERLARAYAKRSQ